MIIFDDAKIYNTKLPFKNKNKNPPKITKQISLEAYWRDSA